jgi:hypothetical protein
MPREITDRGDYLDISRGIGSQELRANGTTLRPVRVVRIQATPQRVNVGQERL